MWYDEVVIYQIYPLGLCGAPLQNDGDPSQADQHRLLRVLDWVDHIKALGATCVLFNPLFESDAHGYDTRDYNKVDCRLGTNADFADVCRTLHEHGIKVVLDGVFNHVGRGFWAFKDVQEKKWDSQQVHVQSLLKCLLQKPRYRVAAELLHWLVQSELHLATW